MDVFLLLWGFWLHLGVLGNISYFRNRERVGVGRSVDFILLLAFAYWVVLHLSFCFGNVEHLFSYQPIREA